jgi:hypothetical protein
LISLSLAQQLKAAGLAWTPALHDFFGIPERTLDDHVFVINDITVFVERLLGHPVVTFHGTPEWALDYELIAELVWLPTEAQLRELLEERLLGERNPRLTLSSTTYGYRCEIQFQGQMLSFEAFGASEAYAAALLHVLSSET